MLDSVKYLRDAPAMSDIAPAETIAAVRRFSRFYTRRIGLLQDGLLDSPFSLAEARVLYELGQRDRATAVELAAELGLDQGYLSRLLRGLEQRGLLQRAPSHADRRASLLSLTPAGRDAFAALDAGSRAQIGALLGPLSAPQRHRLAAALGEAETLLGGERPEPAAPWTLRAPVPGDMGWIVHRQAVLYAREYGWDAGYEALIAGIVSRFVEHFDAARERCWVAERAGEVVGSVFVVRKSDDVAQLRLLYVEPSARGLGIGARLVDRLCAHHAVDQRRAGLRPPHLPGRRFHADGGGAAPQFWPRSGRPDLGTAALAAARIRPRSPIRMAATSFRRTAPSAANGSGENRSGWCSP